MKAGNTQNVVIGSGERETVTGCYTGNKSGGNLIALFCPTDRPRSAATLAPNPLPLILCFWIVATGTSRDVRYLFRIA
jgi:hypothetical protein